MLSFQWEVSVGTGCGPHVGGFLSRTPWTQIVTNAETVGCCFYIQAVIAFNLETNSTGPLFSKGPEYL